MFSSVLGKHGVFCMADSFLRAVGHLKSKGHVRDEQPISSRQQKGKPVIDKYSEKLYDGNPANRQVGAKGT